MRALSDSDERFWDDLIASRGDRAFDTRHDPARAADKAMAEVSAFILDHVGDSRGSILEIGCGNGRQTIALSELFAEVTALDASSEALRLCQERCGSLKNVVCVHGDDRELSSYESGRFDVVYSYATLQHVSDVVRLVNYIGEACRLVSRQGFVVLQLRHPGWRTRVVDRGAFVLRRLTHRTNSKSWQGNVLTASEVRSLVGVSRVPMSVTLRPDAPVLGIPRHLWIVASPSESRTEHDRLDMRAVLIESPERCQTRADD